MSVDINLMGVLWATVASMVVGSIWYADGVFGATWKKLVKLDEKRAKAEMPKAMFGMLVLAFITAYVLAHVTFLSKEFFGDVTYSEAAINSALWLWVGFVMPVIVGNGLFEQRRKKLMAINASNQLVNLLVVALVLGWVGL